MPVVIDDALGFTDPERLTKMGAVFDSVGNHGQVIVLTCMPTRYVGGAERSHRSAPASSVSMDRLLRRAVGPASSVG